jgi:threonine dehydratase
MVTVGEEALADASFEHLERHALLVEPSGAAPLAAVRSGRVSLAGQRAVLVVSGGNAAPAVLGRILGERLGRSAART